MRRASVAHPVAVRRGQRATRLIMLDSPESPGLPGVQTRYPTGHCSQLVQPYNVSNCNESISSVIRGFASRRAASQLECTVRNNLTMVVYLRSKSSAQIASVMDDAVHTPLEVCADRSGHGEVVHRQGTRAKRKRSAVEYHPGARFDSGQAPSHTPPAERSGPGAKRCSDATGSAADEDSPGGSGLSTGAAPASAEREPQSSDNTGGSEDPETCMRSVRRGRVRQPKALAHPTAPDSAPLDRSARQRQRSRRRAGSGAVRRQPPLAAAPADVARTFAQALQSSTRQAIMTGRPAQPKRLTGTRAAYAEQPGCLQDAGIAKDASPPMGSIAADSQVHLLLDKSV